MNFQIKFIESVIERKPDFIEALMALGDLYTKKGLFQKGLDMDLKLSELRPDDPFVYYNLSCSYSLMNNLDEAFRTIKLALEYGYDNFEYLQYDSDLKNLRDDLRFQEFITRLHDKQVEQKKY